MNFHIYLSYIAKVVREIRMMDHERTNRDWNRGFAIPNTLHVLSADPLSFYTIRVFIDETKSVSTSRCHIETNVMYDILSTAKTTSEYSPEVLDS